MRFLFLLSVLFFSFAATAQTSGAMLNEKPVKRVVVDRERVTVFYQDGTVDDNVEFAKIINDFNSTGIAKVGIEDVVEKFSTDGIYAIDGRKLTNDIKTLNQLPKGVYILREGNKVTKTIKQ